MRKQVVEFFEANHFPVIEIIRRGKVRGLHAAQIEQGLEVVYEKREEIRPINLARAVWAEAKTLKGEQYVIAKGIIDDLRKTIKGQRLRFLVLFVLHIATSLAFAYILYLEGYFK